MAFQARYRRYRPQRFGEVKGQEHVVTALRHAVRDETVAHAYLFRGPRGTGKTSTARQGSHTPHGSPWSRASQLSALARILAVEVLPVPLGPLKR